MTPSTKATVRVTPDRDAGRNIVVIVGPGPLLGFRLKGTRKVYETTTYACYLRAVQQHIASEKARKKAERGFRWQR